jgi:hypothetical protein
LRRHRSLLLLLADIDRDCSTSCATLEMIAICSIDFFPLLNQVVSAAGLWQLPFGWSRCRLMVISHGRRNNDA